MRARENSFYTCSFMEKFNKSSELHFPSTYNSWDINTYRENILNDLRNLLNSTSRDNKIRIIELYPYVAKSVIYFGLENKTGSNIDNVDIIFDEIKNAIDIYEPRVKNVRILLSSKVRTIINFNIICELILPKENTPSMLNISAKVDIDKFQCNLSMIRG